MAYNQAIPQPTDRLRTSQGDLLNNFANAGGLGSMLNPNQGYLRFPNQGGDPTFAPPTLGMFGKTAYTVNEIFVNKNIAGGLQAQIPFTASTLSTTAPVLFQDSWFFLPTGYLIKTGTIVVTVPAVNYGVLYPVNVNIPVFTTIISLQITVSQPTLAGSQPFSYGTNNNLGFVARTTLIPSAIDPIQISYLTIGIGA